MGCPFLPHLEAHIRSGDQCQLLPSLAQDTAGRQEGLAGQGCGNGPWETGDKTRCHLGHARDIPPLGGPTAESGLSQVLALLATKLHGATQMSWLWELKHTSCPFLAMRLHARTRESTRPYDRVQEPQILGLREAGAGGHERSKPDPDRNAFGSIFCLAAYAVPTRSVSIWLSWLPKPHGYKELLSVPSPTGKPCVRMFGHNVGQSQKLVWLPAWACDPPDTASSPEAVSHTY